MNRFGLIAGLLAGACALSVQAAGGMRAGQWEYTMKMNMPGMPMQMPPQVYKRCLNQADIDKGEQYKNDRGNRDCEMKNMQQTGSGATYDIACKDGSTGHYEFTYGGDGMSGKGTLKTQGHEMTQEFSAKRLGDCTQ